MVRVSQHGEEERVGILSCPGARGPSSRYTRVGSVQSVSMRHMYCLLAGGVLTNASSITQRTTAFKRFLVYKVVEGIITAALRLQMVKLLWLVDVQELTAYLSVREIMMITLLNLNYLIP